VALISGLVQNGQVIRRDQESDGPCHPGSARDETLGLQGQNHLMHRRWCNLEVSLHVGLRRRASVELGVIENEREVPTLLWGKALVCLNGESLCSFQHAINLGGQAPGDFIHPLR